MAIRIDAAADLLSRTTGLPTFGSWTGMLWVMRVVDQAVDECILYIANSSAFTSYVGCLADASTTALTIDSGLGGSVAAGSPLVINTWYHIALVFDDTANTITAFLNGVQNAQATGNTGTTTWGYEVIGNLTSGGGNMFSGRVAAFKEYTAALTANEIKVEMMQYVPVRTANLHRWSSFFHSADLVDYKGVVNWTASGTLTTENGPAIAWDRHRQRGYVVSGAGGVLTPLALSSAVVPVSTLVKQGGKVISSAVVPVSTMVKSVRKVVGSALTPLSSVVKMVGKVLSSTVTPVSSIALSSLRALVLSSSVAVTTGVVKHIGKVLSSSVISVSTAGRVSGKVLSSSITTTSTVVKRVGKVLSSTVVPVSSALTSAIKALVLSSAVVPVSTVVKMVGKRLSSVVVPLTGVVKQSFKGVSSAIAPVTTVVKRISKVLNSTVTPLTTLVRTLTKVLVLSSAVVPVSAVVKVMGKGLNSGVVPVTTIVKRVGKVLNSAGVVGTTLLRRVVYSRVLGSVVTPLTAVVTTFISGGGEVPGVITMLEWVRRRRRKVK